MTADVYVEVSSILLTDTSAHPRAMVVIGSNASFTVSAVFTPERLLNITYGTELVFYKQYIFIFWLLFWSWSMILI